MELLYILSCIGVNCFVMITGYFICGKETYRWKGIIRTWLETAFYILVIGLITNYFRPDLANVKDIIKYVFLDDSYWFVTCYLGILAVSPLLAIIINKLDRRNYQIVLCVLFILCFQYTYGRIFAGDHSLGWFIFLFFVAGYIRKFPLPEIWIRHKISAIIATWFILFLLATAYNAIKFLKDGEAFRLISSANDGMMFFLSITVFVYFVKTDMESKPFHIIAKISPYMFGVYLIHCSPFCFKQMWIAIIPDHYNIPIIFHCLISCLGVFAGCILIDYIRSKIFNLLRIPKFEGLLAAKLPNLKFQES